MSLHVLQSLRSMVSPIEGRGRGGQVLCDYPFHEINELACSAVLALNSEPKGGERGGLAPLSTGSSYYSMRRPKTLQQLLHHWGHCSARTCTSPRTLPSAAPLLFPLWGQSMSVFHTFSTPLTDALGLRLQPAAKDLVATALPQAMHKCPTLSHSSTLSHLFHIIVHT